MTQHASGTFEVRLNPLSGQDGLPLQRMSIDKQFFGDLEGTSRGEMLAASTAIADSAGYVAIEQVTGALHGRSGTFFLQHNGLMDRGRGSLTVTVIPDSGTGELTGLSGEMTIHVADGKHSYDFDYTLGAREE